MISYSPQKWIQELYQIFKEWSEKDSSLNFSDDDLALITAADHIAHAKEKFDLTDTWYDQYGTEKVEDILEKGGMSEFEAKLSAHSIDIILDELRRRAVGQSPFTFYTYVHYQGSIEGVPPDSLWHPDNEQKLEMAYNSLIEQGFLEQTAPGNTPFFITTKLLAQLVSDALAQRYELHAAGKRGASYYAYEIIDGDHPSKTLGKEFVTEKDIRLFAERAEEQAEIIAQKEFYAAKAQFLGGIEKIASFGIAMEDDPYRYDYDGRMDGAFGRKDDLAIDKEEIVGRLLLKQEKARVKNAKDINTFMPQFFSEDVRRAYNELVEQGFIQEIIADVKTKITATEKLTAAVIDYLEKGIVVKPGEPANAISIVAEINANSRKGLDGGPIS